MTPASLGAMTGALDFNDPRSAWGDKPRPAWRRGYPETWWKVEGWNPEPGGSCSYGGCATKEEAIAEAQKMREHGDYEGKRYENYDVLEMHFQVMVTVTVHDIPDREGDVPL